MEKPVKKPVKKLVKDLPQVKIYVDTKTLKAVKSYIKKTGIRQNRLIVDAINFYIASLNREITA
jgi:hypothetical protein